MDWMIALYVFLGVFAAIVAGIFFVIGLFWLNAIFGGNLLTPLVSVGRGVWWCIRQSFKFVAIVLLGFLALIAALLGLLGIVGRKSVARLRKVLKAARPGLRFLLRSHENVGLVFLWPLIAYNIAHIFLGYGSSRRAWHEVLQDPWQLGGVVFASFVLTLFIAAIVKNGTLRASPTYQKYAWRIMLGIIILMILLPWLWRLADNQIHSRPEPRAAIHTTGAQDRAQGMDKKSAAAYDRDPFFNPPGVAESRILDFDVDQLHDNYSFEVAISGRDKFGFEALTLAPGQEAFVAYKRGDITTWSRAYGHNTMYSIWGNYDIPASYVQKNFATEDSWDWSGNFRYSSMVEQGVLPSEMLVIVGKVGSGEEEIFQFPKDKLEITVVNNKGTSQPLVFYYHTLTNFYVGNGGACASASGMPLIYPSKEATYTCRDFTAELVSGWDDQGLNGDRVIFSVTVNR